MIFHIGDKVEIISEGYKEKIKENGKEDIGNVGVIDHIDDCWLSGAPYKVIVGYEFEYWAWDSELRLDRNTLIKEKKKEIENLKRVLSRAERQLNELLEK